MTDSSGPLAGVSGAQIVGRAPGNKAKNPIADVDLLLPLTEEQIAQYSAWLSTLIEFDLDPEDAHSVCAHCRYGDLGIVQARDQLEKVFKKEYLLSENYLHPGLLGFDPRNRDELGGNWHQVHELLPKIKRVGWSDAETKNAVCVEILPNDKTVEEWNQRLVVDVPLKQVETGSLTHSTLGCGHTNCGLRAIEAECSNNDPRISVNGKLSRAHIAKTDKPFAEAVVRGLWWKILHHSVRTKYPESLTIIIAAYNVYGSVQQKPSEIQGLLQLYRMAKQMQDCGKDPDWVAIKKTVLDSEPPFAADIDFLTDFIICKAGHSKSATFLQKFIACHRQFVPAKRRIPGEVYSVLADFPLVNLAWAACLAAYTGTPSSAAKNDISDFVSSAALTKLNKLLETAKKTSHTCSEVVNQETPQAVVLEPMTVAACVAAEVVLMQVSKRMASAGISEDHWISNNKLNKATTHLSEALVRFILGKDQRKERDVSHLHGCAWHFVEDLKEIFPELNESELTKTWPKAPEGAPPAKTKAAKSSSSASSAKAKAEPKTHVYDINNLGVVVDPIYRLRAQGFDLEYVIGEIGVENSFYSILSVDQRGVTLQPLVKSQGCAQDGILNAVSECLLVDVDTVLEKYESKKAKDIKIRHPGWKAVRPIKKETQLTFQRAFATWAAHHISEYCETSFAKVFDYVDCLQKPRHMAIAKAECSVGALVIAPESSKVSSYETAKMHEMRGDRRGKITLMNTPHQDYTFLLNPWIEEERAAAFWFVETTEDPTKANMAYAVGSYDCTTGTELTPPTGIKIVPRPTPVDNAPDDNEAHRKRARLGTKVADPSAKSNEILVEAPEDAHKYIVRVPILINHKALKKDDVLMVYLKDEKQGEKRAQSSTPAKPISVARARRQR